MNSLFLVNIFQTYTRLNNFFSSIFVNFRVNLYSPLWLRILFPFLLIITPFPSLFAQNVLVDSLNNHITAYKFYKDFTGYENQPMDTTLTHFEIYNNAFSNFTINPYLGNRGSAVNPILTPYNINSYDLIFNQSVRYLFFNPEACTYYQTKSPYTNLTYFTSGPKARQEQNLFVTHTQNVNKKMNVGFLGRLNYSDGQYINQKIKGSSFNIFSSYHGTRYRYNLSVNFNTLKSNENGGLYGDSLYENSNVPANTLDVSLQSATSTNKSLTALFQHRYYITGSYNINDSVKSTSPWNEAVSIIHRMYYQKSSRTYYDDLTSESNNYYDRDFYHNIYRDSSLTKDSTYYRRFENSFLLAINAFPLLKIPAELRFGIKTQLEKSSYTNLGYYYEKAPAKKFPTYFLVDTVKKYKNHTFDDLYINSAFVGTLANRISKTLSWGASAELYFTGYKAGNLYVSGDLTKIAWKNFVMSLNGDFSVEKPSYFIQDFESNHFKWHNSFDSKQSTTLLKASFSHSKQKVSIVGESGSYINYVYFDSLALPEIADKPLTMYRITLKKALDWKILHSMFRLSLQQTTNDKAMPMPLFSGFNSSYIELFIFQRVMQLQFGFDLFYNSSYYANAYMPATGLFYSQNQVKIGNFPFTDVFLNIKIKRARLSLKYENITSFFAIPGKYYAPHYPFNPGILKIGISWNFYD